MIAPALGTGRVAALAVRTAVGVLLVGAGWWGARDEVALDRQAPWIAVAVAGAIVAAASGALWLLSFRRSVVVRVLAVVEAVDGLAEPETAAVSSAARVAVPGPAATLFHRPDCELVAGRPVDRADRPRWLAEGRLACEACDP